MIFGIDNVEYRLNLAKKMGGDVIIEGSKEQVVDTIMKATDGRGVDVFFEMSGAPPSFEEGFRALRPGGTAVLFGLPSKNVEFDLATWIVFKAPNSIGASGRRL